MNESGKKFRVIKEQTLRLLIETLNGLSISKEELVLLDTEKCQAIIYY